MAYTSDLESSVTEDDEVVRNVQWQIVSHSALTELLKLTSHMFAKVRPFFKV